MNNEWQIWIKYRLSKPILVHRVLNHFYSVFHFHSFIVNIGCAYSYIFHLCLLRVSKPKLCFAIDWYIRGTFDTKSLNYTLLWMPLVGYFSYLLVYCLVGAFSFIHRSNSRAVAWWREIEKKYNWAPLKPFKRGNCVANI